MEYLCLKNCLISVIFIISMIYLTFNLEKKLIKSEFKNSLTQNQLSIYLNIINERKQIYYHGYILGFLISICFIIWNNLNESKMDKITMLCLITSVSFISNYFYYILKKKSDYMILHLEKNQISLWLKIYKHMQYHYHFGLLLGIIAVIFFANAFC